MSWGGRREGAGRKPGPRPIVPRKTRPPHSPRNPVYVILRGHASLPSLKARAIGVAVTRAIALGTTGTFKVTHHVVLPGHIHLIVEAAHRGALWKGLQGLAIRIAKAVNSVLDRKGTFWGDRYHARELGTPREVRDALAAIEALR